MFGHAYRYLFATLLGIYSFLNISLLDGDRLYQVDLPAHYLLIVVFYNVFGIWIINEWLEKKSSFFPKTIHPLIIQFVVSLVFVGLLASSSVLITGNILGGPFSYSWQNFFFTAAFVYRVNLFLNSVNAIYYFNKKFSEKKLEAERLKTLTVNAKLDALNAQINPHFFFNNLSILSSLIYENPKLADQYLHKLSDIYRYILNKRNVELVSLEEELTFLKKYIELLEIRFQGSLSFQQDIHQECLPKLLPPAVLQLLVENVVKHNYFTDVKPLEVSISASSDAITIHNKKQVKSIIETSTGIGLENIRARYKFLGRNVHVVSTEEFFEVKLPLIEPYENSDSRG
ncbi:sensor histidine kinase [Mongoliitalea daihaiensis]|uniref:sensor histidine kinase n=1 Tax=Mongoliitalea daihaiensis TaxID=2782006 RepID=UPI001F22B87C|nr:histidine kinase [Mongoliitalea daihaiensis]UJP64603.1 histidine kinase [Mongoliitalea daihaiensis]